MKKIKKYRILDGKIVFLEKKTSNQVMSEPFFTVLMDFSGVYDEEGFEPRDCVRLDYRSLSGTECWCDPGSEAQIRSSLSTYGPEGIHWIDSGDYHYLSLFWMEKIREPFALLLLDHHSDSSAPAFGADVLSCGSWVLRARQTLPLLREVAWVGGPCAPAPLSEDLPVYLSIDKDVMCRCCARTNWDQGEMTLEQLELTVREMLGGRRLIGADVCGEQSFSKGGGRFDMEVNRETNLELQNFLLSLRNQHN